MTAFLNERIRDPKPPTQESPVQAAVAQLQSRDPAARKPAAQDLLDLAPQSLENMVDIGGYLTNDVIR